MSVNKEIIIRPENGVASFGMQGRLIDGARGIQVDVVQNIETDEDQVKLSFSFNESTDEDPDYTRLNIHLYPKTEEITPSEIRYDEIVRHPEIFLEGDIYEVYAVTLSYDPETESGWMGPEENLEEQEENEFWAGVKAEPGETVTLGMPGLLKGGLAGVSASVSQWTNGEDVIFIEYVYSLVEENEPQISTVLDVHCYESWEGVTPEDDGYKELVRTPDLILDGISYDIWLGVKELPSWE